MPAYNFKKEFAPMVENGSKRQTIRKKRKRPTKPGDTLYLYTGLRTKYSRKIGEHICKSVENVYINDKSKLLKFHPVIKINGIKLKRYINLLTLARNDGFNTVKEFIQFFEKTYGFPFSGELIKW